MEPGTSLDECVPFQEDTEQSNLETQNIVSSLALCTVTRQQSNLLTPCCRSSISTKGGKFVSSECNKLFWSRYDKQYIDKHFLMYILNKYSRFEKSIRILLYLFYFIDRLYQKVGNGKYSSLSENVCRSLATKSGLYLSYKIALLSTNHSPSILFQNYDNEYEMMIPREYLEVCITAVIREGFILQHMPVILSIYPNQIYSNVKYFSKIFCLFCKPYKQFSKP